MRDEGELGAAEEVRATARMATAIVTNLEEYIVGKMRVNVDCEIMSLGIEALESVLNDGSLTNDERNC